MLELSPLWRREIRSGLRRRSVFPLMIVIAGALRLSSPHGNFALPLMGLTSISWRITPEEVALLIYLAVTVSWTLRRDRGMRWAIWVTPIGGEAIAWPKTLGPTLPTLLAIAGWRWVLFTHSPAATLAAWGFPSSATGGPQNGLMTLSVMLSMVMLQPTLAAMATTRLCARSRSRPIFAVMMAIVAVWFLLVLSAVLVSPRGLALPVLLGFVVVWLVVRLNAGGLLALVCVACLLGLVSEFDRLWDHLGMGTIFVLGIAGVFSAVVIVQGAESNLSLVVLWLLATLESWVLLIERGLLTEIDLMLLPWVLVLALLLLGFKWAVWVERRFRRAYLRGR